MDALKADLPPSRTATVARRSFSAGGKVGLYHVLIAIAISTPAFAQEAMLRVTVVEDRTSAPVTQVQVSVEGENGIAQDLGNGTFELAVAAGPHTIVASGIGYAVARFPVDAIAGQTTAITIRLSEGAGSYTEKVDVFGTLGRSTGDQPVGSMTVFGRDLQNLRGAVLDDPLRAVQALPAVSATDDFYSEFSVRGSPFRHIGLTVDGIPSKYLMHTVNDVVDGGSVTMINSDTLGAVELLPGSYAEKAGRHIGAEVNLRTRDGSRDRFHGRAGLSGTSVGFLAEGPLANRRGSWLASIRRSYLDYLIKRIDPDAGFAFGFVDAQAKVSYDLSGRHNVDFIALFGRAVFDGRGDYDDVNDTAYAVSRSWLSSLGWRYTASNRLVFTNRAYITGLEFANDNPFSAPLDVARFNHVGWRIDGTFSLPHAAVLEFGGDAEAQSGRHTRNAAPPASPTLITAGDYSADASTASAYTQLILPVHGITITPGVRVDRWSMTDATTTSPWLNVSVAPWANTTIKAGTGIYRQFADFDQVYGLNGGGPDLEPEQAVHVDAGVEQRLGRELSLQVTGFVRRESGVLWPQGAETRLVGNRIVPGSFTADWTNALDGNARGGEVVIRRDSPTGLSGWIGYAYARLRYDHPAGDETFWANADQRHTVVLYGNYRLTSRTSVSVRYRYGSNFPITGYLTTSAAAPIDPETNQPAYYQLTDVRNTVRLPAYSRIDARAEHAFQWGSRRLVVFVEAANLQDRKNLRNTPYSVDRSGRAFGVTETMMPIVPSAGFVVEF